MSYNAEIKVVNDPKFYSNGIALATAQEARDYGEHKLDTWSSAVEYRVVESDEPVNYKWNQELRVLVKVSA